MWKRGDGMDRYLMTQSLISSWAYMFDCYEGQEENANAEFERVLRRERTETTPEMQNGLDFERAVYLQAAGAKRENIPEWERGIRSVASIIRGAQTQVKASKEIEVCGMRFLVYGILDALKAGIIYDVKFTNKGLGKADIYGKYLDSPQHPFYLYLVPEATEFKYLVSDGEDVYIESYRREDARKPEDIIAEFIQSITASGQLEIYKKHWLAL